MPSNSNPSTLQCAKAVLRLLTPSREVYQSSSALTHLTLSGKTIPLEYIRERLPVVYQSQFLNEQSSTHRLRLVSQTQETIEIPIHDIVLITQCFKIRRVAKLLPEQNPSRPVLVMQGVPHIHTFLVLLRWLYSKDREELKAELERLDWDATLGFARNCRLLGVIDPQLVSVVRSVFGM